MFLQDNQSKSNKNVIRGLHFQKPPFAQGKLVRVIKGAVLDVAVDIRINSPYYGKWEMHELSEKNKNILEEIKKRNSISIHIRRGDYVNDINAKKILGDNCNLLYYQKAIEYIYSVITSPFFYIFSDEPEWVKNNFSFLENSLIIDWNKGKDSWQDMMLMSHCKHNIIANSSFSWWGAWLNNNNNKIVIAPKKWFNTFEAPYIVPNEWIRI